METSFALISFIIWLLGAGSPIPVKDMHENQFVYPCLEEEVISEHWRRLCQPIYNRLYLDCKAEIREEMVRRWYVRWQPNLSFSEAAGFRQNVGADYYCPGPNWEALIDYGVRNGQPVAEINAWKREAALDSLFFQQCEGCGELHHIEGEPEKAYNTLVELGEKEGLTLAAEYIGKKYLRVFTDAYANCLQKDPDYSFDPENLKLGIYWFSRAGWSNKQIKEVVESIKPQLEKGKAVKEAVQAVNEELAKL